MYLDIIFRVYFPFTGWRQQTDRELLMSRKKIELKYRPRSTLLTKEITDITNNIED